MTKTFICYICHGKFEENGSDEEVIAELHKNFGENYSPEDCAIVCNDCYNKIMKNEKE